MQVTSQEPLFTMAAAAAVAGIQVRLDQICGQMLALLEVLVVVVMVLGTTDHGALQLQDSLIQAVVVVAIAGVVLRKTPIQWPVVQVSSLSVSYQA